MHRLVINNLFSFCGGSWSFADTPKHFEKFFNVLFMYLIILGILLSALKPLDLQPIEHLAITKHKQMRCFSGQIIAVLKNWEILFVSFLQLFYLYIISGFIIGMSKDNTTYIYATDMLVFAFWFWPPAKKFAFSGMCKVQFPSTTAWQVLVPPEV